MFRKNSQQPSSSSTSGAGIGALLSPSSPANPEVNGSTGMPITNYAEQQQMNGMMLPGHRQSQIMHPYYQQQQVQQPMQGMYASPMGYPMQQPQQAHTIPPPTPQQPTQLLPQTGNAPGNQQPKQIVLTWDDLPRLKQQEKQLDEQLMDIRKKIVIEQQLETSADSMFKAHSDRKSKKKAEDQIALAQKRISMFTAEFIRTFDQFRTISQQARFVEVEQLRQQMRMIMGQNPLQPFFAQQPPPPPGASAVSTTSAPIGPTVPGKSQLPPRGDSIGGMGTDTLGRDAAVNETALDANGNPLPEGSNASSSSPGRKGSVNHGGLVGATSNGSGSNTPEPLSFVPSNVSSPDTATDMVPASALADAQKAAEAAKVALSEAEASKSNLAQENASLQVQVNTLEKKCTDLTTQLTEMEQKIVSSPPNPPPKQITTLSIGISASPDVSQRFQQTDAPPPTTAIFTQTDAEELNRLSDGDAVPTDLDTLQTLLKRKDDTVADLNRRCMEGLEEIKLLREKLDSLKPEEERVVNRRSSVKATDSSTGADESSEVETPDEAAVDAPRDHFSELAQLRVAKQELTAKVDQLETSLKVAQTENQDLAKSIVDYEEWKKRISSTFESKLSNLQTSIESTKETELAKQSKLVQDLERLNNTLDQVNQEKQVLQFKVATLERDKETLLKEAQEASAIFKQVSDELRETKDKLVTSETESKIQIGSLTTELEATKLTMTQAEQSLSEKSLELQELRVHSTLISEKLEQTSTTLTAQLERTQTKLASCELRERAVRDTANILEHQVRMLKSSEEAWRVKFETAVMESTLNEKQLTSRIRSLESTEEELQKTKHGLEVELESMTRSYTDACQKLKVTQAEQEAMDASAKSIQTALETRVSKLLENVSGLEQERDELKNKIQDLDVQLNEMRASHLKEKSVIAEDHKIEIDSLKSQIKNLESLLAAEKASVEDLKKQVADLTSELRATQMALGKASADLQSTIAKLTAVESKLETTKRTLQDTEDDLNNTKTTLTSTQSELAQMKKQAEQLTKDLADATGKIEQLEKMKRQLNTTIGGHEETIFQLETSTKKQEATIAALEKEKKSLSADLASKTAEVNDKDRMMLEWDASHQKLVRSLKDQLEHVRNNSASMEEFDALRKDVFTSNQYAAQAVKEKEKAMAEAVQLRVQVQELEQAISALRSRNQMMGDNGSSMDSRVQDLLDRNNKLTQDLLEKQTEITALKNKLAQELEEKKLLRA